MKKKEFIENIMNILEEVRKNYESNGGIINGKEVSNYCLIDEDVLDEISQNIFDIFVDTFGNKFNDEVYDFERDFSEQVIGCSLRVNDIEYVTKFVESAYDYYESK